MTVCIAAACERATKVVVATDRLLSYGGVASENLAGKMIWIGDWLVLYAGTPSNTAMIIAALRETARETTTSENVRQVFRAAYQRRKGILSSFPSLSAYDMSLERFEREGLRIFGRTEFNRISQEISETGREFLEQMLVVGWGATPHAVMLYEVSPAGDWDHHFTGVAAIGTGGDVALSTMLLLGQSRDSSLAETLYTVAAAKFASEKSTDGDVGRKTSIYVSWKRSGADVPHKPPGKFLEEEHIKELHAAWDRYGRPRISDPVFPVIGRVLRSLGLEWCQTNAEASAIARLASQAPGQNQEPPVTGGKG